MKTQVKFRSFEGLTHHYEFVNETIDKTIGQFDTSRPMSAIVRVLKAVKRAAKTGAPEYHFELVLYNASHKRPIIVNKDANDFYEGIRKLCRTTEKILRRNSKTKSKLRRREANAIKHAADAWIAI